jgi:hypothetical protein
MPRKTTRNSEARPAPRSSTELELPLRIEVIGPLPGVLHCVQGRLGEYLTPARSTGEDLTFDVSVRAVPGSTPRLLGPVVQGPPAKRFLYICTGTCAGDTSSCWTRRAKLPLTSIDSALIALAKPGQRLTATIDGKARDGGPACATVPLLGGGWKWTADRHAPGR